LPAGASGNSGANAGPGATGGLPASASGNSGANAGPGATGGLPASALPLPRSPILSPHPRPDGAGFDKGRAWRFIPILEAYTDDNEWRGNPVTLLINTDGPYKGSQWASFGVSDPDWYTTAQARACIRRVAERIRRGLYLVDGGANFYTYFEDQTVTLGARTVNVGSTPATALSARLVVSDAASDVAAKEWSLDLVPAAVETKSETWTPPRWPDAGYRVTAELLENGLVIDRLNHEIHVWRPKASKEFVRVEDGNFTLAGKRWRAHGVNYMPSSGIGAEDGLYFEQWLGATAYDPVIIQRDLDHCKDLGLNAVSIFLYHQSMKAQNLLDILRRLDALGMKANLSLRPGTPLDFEWDKMREMVEYYRLRDNDTVFAYDLAWEPLWLQHKDRKRWDTAWEAWIIERYGSIENAERDWAVPVPRDEAGKVTNPQGEQITKDGEWRRMVAAYRRCLDTLLYKYYSAARTLMRSVDPNHMVSFRMTEAGDPTMEWGEILPYDFPYLVAAVDILEPEAYGRIGDWEKIKPGWFEFEYARWAAPDMPMMWAEAGLHAWDVGLGTSPPERLDAQGKFYRDFYRMMISSAADGIFWWWYPGGFRVGENSDYGIINPDGSDRPNSKAIRENADALINGPDAKPIDQWIEVDRDANARGIVGIYATVKDEFWKAIEQGKTPGLRTAGTGTNSGNCPLLAVGNTPCNGTNPPKFLDGFFDSVEIRNADGKWTKIEKGGQIEVSPGAPVVARVTLTNLGEAQWLSEGAGRVFVTVAGSVDRRTPIPASTPPRRAVTVDNVVLAETVSAAPQPVTLSLVADGRTPFGEKYTLTLAPRR